MFVGRTLSFCIFGELDVSSSPCYFYHLLHKSGEPCTDQ